jgi:exopolysaccharide biosynthesis protein
LGEGFVQRVSATKIKVLLSIVSMVVLIFTSFAPQLASAQTLSNGVLKDQFSLGQGTQYSDYRYSTSTNNEAVRMIKVNMNAPYSAIEVGIPNPLNHRLPTTRQANLTNSAGHYVVGAVNGSFFNMGTGEPLSLITQNDQIINMGVLKPDDVGSPLHMPVAFGITSSGNPLIDDYHANVNFVHNGVTLPLDNINTMRSANTAVLYTPSFSSTTTETNQWGAEIVVENASTDTSHFKFGDSITGTVTKVTKMGEAGNSVIPQNGFVISVTGSDWYNRIADIQIGDMIQINAQIDNEWMGSKFMLGSGPMLVKNGQVSLSMSGSSSFAKTLSPRTAVAINYDKNQVFFVTVDGRAPGYSNGLSLVDFANYLMSLGVDEAMNLDGGGSTTMSVRLPGAFKPTLANTPSDGSERYVSSILQVVNTAPTGAPTYFQVNNILKGMKTNSSTTLSLKYILDQYFNPISFQPGEVTWGVKGNIGTMSGSTFTASGMPGSGTITATYQNVTKEFPVTVVSAINFTDLSKDKNWAYESIMKLANLDIINGFPDGSFQPDKPITRLDAATMISKQLGLNTSKNQANPGFKDVNSNTYGYGTIAAVANNGIVGGFSDGTFRPQETLTRAQLASILTRAYDLVSAQSVSAQAIKFVDLSSNHWAYKPIQSIVKSGIASGYPDNTFRADKAVSRAEFASMLQRCID